MFEAFGWNADNMFFLTRDHPIEITEVDKLFYYGNQALFDVKDGLDEFGRNYIDKIFISLCLGLHIFFSPPSNAAFKSLIAWKDGDNYIARLRYNEVDMEKEIVVMHQYFVEQSKTLEK
jgi:hypothetical protein